jgi:hypothetical protein
MTTETQSRRITQRLRYVLPILLVVVGVLALASNINITKVFQQNATSPLLTPQPTPAPSSTYTSDKLGISFSYITTVSGRVNFFTREIGDTVYLYYNPASNQPFSGTDTNFQTHYLDTVILLKSLAKTPNNRSRMRLSSSF